MFNLDQAISEWRRELIAAGIRNNDVLDELESHLREDLERRARSERDISQLFRTAVAQLGEPRSIKVQFDRIEERKYMKRVLMIGAGIVGVLVGMALVMPAVAQYRQLGAMRNGEPWLFLIGSLLTLGGCFAAIRSFRKARA